MDTSWVGYAAAILTTVSFVPQAYKTWKTRDTSGISLIMYSMFVLGIVAWLAYGVLMHSWPMILANSITLLLSGAIWGMKVRAVVKGDGKPLGPF